MAGKYDSQFSPMSNNRLSAPGTNGMEQQRNINMKRGEDNARDAWLRKGGQQPQGTFKAGPKVNLDGTAGIPGVQKPMMHSAVAQNTRQFSNVGQGLKSTLGRLRTATRLQGMLRKFK